MHRVYKPKRQFKSKLEMKVAKMIGKQWEYEITSFPYVQERKYITDFTKKGKKVHLEVKGFFRPGDVSKYKAVKATIDSKGEELIFVLADPNKKVRKGAKSTMADWCDKNGYRWCSVNNVKQWLQENL